jgi:hypothetical protein
MKTSINEVIVNNRSSYIQKDHTKNNPLFECIMCEVVESVQHNNYLKTEQ